MSRDSLALNPKKGSAFELYMHKLNIDTKTPIGAKLPNAELRRLTRALTHPQFACSGGRLRVPMITSYCLALVPVFIGTCLFMKKKSGH